MRILRLLWLAVVLAVAADGRAGQPAPAADIQRNIDWSAVLGMASPFYPELPSKPVDGPMVGNGLLGTYLIRDKTTGEVRFEMSREDLNDVRANFAARKTNGYFKLGLSSGQPTGTAELDLWNAQIKAELCVREGVFGVRAFADANSNVIVFELTQLRGKPVDYQWDFVPDRQGYAGAKEPKGGYRPYPAPTLETLDGCQVSAQDMPVGAEYNTQKEPGPSQHATAWRVVKGTQPGQTHIFTSVGYSYQRGPVAKQEAVEAVNNAVAKGFAAIEAGHRKWWHDYYQKSYVSMPEKYETFHWLQTYKIACIARETNRHIPDLQGLWFDRNVGWNGIWWNWNLHTMFSSVFASNHPELINCLLNYIWDRRKQMTFGGGYGIGRYSVLYRNFGDGPEHGNLSSVLCMLWENFLVTQNVEMLKTTLFPLLKGNYTYLMSNTTRDSNGILHIPNGLSPEWNNLKKFNNALFNDTAYDLSALRWVCRTLMEANDTYGLNDPDRAKWRNTLDKITPYATDPKEGFMIAEGIHLDEGYRHPAHEYMMWPYLEYTPDDPGQNEMIEKTLNHHDALGYSVFGMANAANAIVRAMQGRGDQALAGLDGNSETYLQMPFISKRTGRLAYFANSTGYCEEGPYLAHRVLEEMLLSSFNGIIRVFPAIPSGKEWDNLAIDNFRAKGAFLVSAVRKDKQTRFIKITSLAGRECKVKTGMNGKINLAGNQGCTLMDFGNGVVQVNGLKAGQWCIIYPGASMPDLTICPVVSDAKPIMYPESSVHSSSAAWQVDLGANYNLDKIALKNGAGLSNFTVSVLNSDSKVEWTCSRYGNTGPFACFTGIERTGRYVRLRPNGGQALNPAGVQIFGTRVKTNIAAGKTAAQSSTMGTSVASLAVDGNTDGMYDHGSVTHSNQEAKPWWKVDLGQEVPIDCIKIWNRTDAATERLSHFTVSILDENSGVVWIRTQASAPKPSASWEGDQPERPLLEGSVERHQLSHVGRGPGVLGRKGFDKVKRSILIAIAFVSLSQNLIAEERPTPVWTCHNAKEGAFEFPNTPPVCWKLRSWRDRGRWWRTGRISDPRRISCVSHRSSSAPTAEHSGCRIRPTTWRRKTVTTRVG